MTTALASGPAILLPKTGCISSPPPASFYALPIQSIDVDDRFLSCQPRDTGHKAVPSDEVQDDVVASGQAMKAGKERMDDRIEVFVGDGGQFDQLHPPVGGLVIVDVVAASVDGDAVAALYQPGAKLFDAGLEAGVGSGHATRAHEGDVERCFQNSISSSDHAQIRVHVGRTRNGR